VFLKIVHSPPFTFVIAKVWAFSKGMNHHRKTSKSSDALRSMDRAVTLPKTLPTGSDVNAVGRDG